MRHGVEQIPPQQKFAGVFSLHLTGAQMKIQRAEGCADQKGQSNCNKYLSHVAAEIYFYKFYGIKS
ncbi:MAG: hypothetical protein CMI63_00535 [Parvularcula sp.]|nr:hypothetical protein [Parvularcula sp.]